MQNSGNGDRNHESPELYTRKAMFAARLEDQETTTYLKVMGENHCWERSRRITNSISHRQQKGSPRTVTAVTIDVGPRWVQ